MRRRRLTPFLCAVLLLLAVPAGRSPSAAGRGDTLRIGILAPLSGPYASGGSSFLQAARLAEEEANAQGGVLGRRVEIVVADTQGKVETARAEGLRLVSREKAFALVGAYLSEETVGAMEAAAASRRILMVPVAATAEITDKIRSERARYRYVFRAGYAIPQWAGMLSAFLAERKIRTYAFVGAAIRWNRELAKALKASLSARGIRSVHEAFYSPGNPAFDPVAVAAARSGADILVLGDPGKGSLEFAKRVRDFAPKLPLLSVGGTLGDGRVAETLPATAPLFVQAAAWPGGSPEATRYGEAFEKRYGYPPSGYSDTLPHDALAVLLAAVRAAGRLETDAVVRALETGSFPAVAGAYRFDPATHQALWTGGPEGLHGTVISWEPGGARVVYPHPRPPRPSRP